MSNSENTYEKDKMMINQIIGSQVINRAVGHITDKLSLKLERFTIEYNKDVSWNNIVQEVIKATEGIDEETGKYIFSRLSIISFKNQLFAYIQDNIYRTFILSLAMELCKFDKEKDFSISLGTAVLDKRLDKNKLLIKSDNYNIRELDMVISDREILYSSYFKLFEEENGPDIIEVFYPKNGESWIRWNDKYSVNINVNLSKGLSYGFCREGFDYHKICNNEYKTLKCAYIENGKEILRFDDISYEKNNLLIWIR